MHIMHIPFHFSRYANRAKQIKTKAVVNENPLDKLIRELKEENDKLKAKLAGGLEPSVNPLDPEGIATRFNIQLPSCPNVFPLLI